MKLYIRNFYVGQLVAEDKPTWVEATNIDGTSLSTTSSAQWLLSDSGSSIFWSGDNWTWIANQNMYGGSNNASSVSEVCSVGPYSPSIYAVRKHVPGHWLRYNGVDWVGGTWSGWTCFV